MNSDASDEWRKVEKSGLAAAGEGGRASAEGPFPGATSSLGAPDSLFLSGSSVRYGRKRLVEWLAASLPMSGAETSRQISKPCQREMPRNRRSTYTTTNFFFEAERPRDD
ncbi:hypothetical protein KM043_004864 [Ampulex compressa]|nr:hypothetical protein KM043_004864 [Ampulex compressa]